MDCDGGGGGESGSDANRQLSDWKEEWSGGGGCHQVTLKPRVALIGYKR